MEEVERRPLNGPDALDLSRGWRRLTLLAPRSLSRAVLVNTVVPHRKWLPPMNDIGIGDSLPKCPGDGVASSLLRVSPATCRAERLGHALADSDVSRASPRSEALSLQS